RRRHTIFSRDWSSDVCSSDLADGSATLPGGAEGGGTGIGVGVALTVADVTNEARIGVADITADGVTVEALVPEVGGDGATHSFAAEASSGASGGNTSVAGALAINIGLSEASATLADGATVTVTDSGAVELKAENFTANDATATASQEEGGNIGVGASI